jgi:hypothetical protein
VAGFSGRLRSVLLDFFLDEKEGKMGFPSNFMENNLIESRRKKKNPATGTMERLHLLPPRIRFHN